MEFSGRLHYFGKLQSLGDTSRCFSHTCSNSGSREMLVWSSKYFSKRENAKCKRMCLAIPLYITHGILYAPNCLDFWQQAKTVQKNWLKLVLCLQILNLDWTTLWNHLNSLPNGHSGIHMVLDLFWTSKPCKSSQKAPKQNSPLILLQNFGPPIIFWKTQFFGIFITIFCLKNSKFFRNYLFCSKNSSSPL